MTDEQNQSSEDQSTEEQAQDAPEEAKETEAAETPEDQAEESQDEDSTEEADDGDHDELPDWGRKQLKRARDEAAKYRTQLREAQSKLSEATSPDEFEAVKKELAQAQLELETERIASRHHLPDEIRQVLKGSTPEEIEAHAEILAKFVGGGNAGVDPDDVRGGLHPSDTDDGVTDPRTLAAKHRRS